jgi:hypothetical protein
LSHQTWAEDFHLQAAKHARHTRNPRQLTELPHVANRTRAEVSRAVERFAKQQVSGQILQK